MQGWRRCSGDGGQRGGGIVGVNIDYPRRRHRRSRKANVLRVQRRGGAQNAVVQVQWLTGGEGGIPNSCVGVRFLRIQTEQQYMKQFVRTLRQNNF